MKPKRITQRDLPTLPDGTYTIGNGLYLRKRGKYGSFFFRGTIGGKRKDIALGSMSELTLNVAKEAAEQLRTDIKTGEYEKRERAKDSTVPTFEAFWEDALRTHAKARQWRTEKHYTDKASIIRRYALPVLKDYPVSEIGRDEILLTVQELWNTQTRLADELLYLLRSILALAVVKGYLPQNPATWSGNLSLFLPPKSKVHKVKHYHALPFRETALVLGLSRRSPHVAGARVGVLAIMTARRKGEIIQATWDEFDLEAGVWTVPDEHMKIHKGHPRSVPLPTQLVAIMKEWKEQSGESRYVCSSDFSRYLTKIHGHSATEKPLVASYAAKVVSRFVKMITDKPFTLHGFRSTFTDWCAVNRKPVDVVEMCLDHETGNAVRQAYFRADLLDQRREVLQSYADALFEVIEKAEKEGGVASNDATPKEEGKAD